MLRESAVAYSSLPQEDSAGVRGAVPAFVTTRTTKTPHSRRDCQLTSLIIALVVSLGVTLAVVLPLALKSQTETIGRKEIQEIGFAGGQENLPGLGGEEEFNGEDEDTQGQNSGGDSSALTDSPDSEAHLPVQNQNKTVQEPPTAAPTTAKPPTTAAKPLKTTANPPTTAQATPATHIAVQPTLPPFFPPALPSHTTSGPKGEENVGSGVGGHDFGGKDAGNGETDDNSGETDGNKAEPGGSKGETEDSSDETSESKEAQGNSKGETDGKGETDDSKETGTGTSDISPKTNDTNSNSDNKGESPDPTNTTFNSPAKPSTTQSFSGWMNKLIHSHDETTLIVLVIAVAVAVAMVIATVAWLIYKKVASRRRRINIQSVITDLQSRDKVVLLNSEDSEDEQ